MKQIGRTIGRSDGGDGRGGGNCNGSGSGGGDAGSKKYAFMSDPGDGSGCSACMRGVPGSTKLYMVPERLPRSRKRSTSSETRPASAARKM